MFNSLHTIHIEMKQIRCIIVLTIVSFMGGGLVCTVLTTMKYTPVRTTHHPSRLSFFLFSSNGLSQKEHLFITGWLVEEGRWSTNTLGEVL